MCPKTVPLFARDRSFSYLSTYTQGDLLSPSTHTPLKEQESFLPLASQEGTEDTQFSLGISGKPGWACLGLISSVASHSLMSLTYVRTSFNFFWAVFGASSSEFFPLERARAAFFSFWARPSGKKRKRCCICHPTKTDI